jgi:NifB/MoaA-like Fe-S oxidoreductase
MKDLVEYIFSILNIKTENALVLQDITTELSKVNDIIAYKNFIRDNIKSVEVDYLTGFQKFIQLTSKYLQQQEDIILDAKYKQGEKYAKELSAKVKECRNFVSDNLVDFSDVGTKGNKYFKDHEIRMLNKIGSREMVIEYSKINRLAGEIYKEYVKAVQDKQLPNKNRDVMRLVRKTL